MKQPGSKAGDGEGDSEKATKVGEARLKKFIGRINKLIDDYREARFVRDHINEFYYMQKREELKVLYDQMEEAQKRLNFFKERFDTGYRDLFVRWRRDARWLNGNTPPGSGSEKVTDEFHAHDDHREAAE